MPRSNRVYSKRKFKGNQFVKTDGTISNIEPRTVTDVPNLENEVISPRPSPSASKIKLETANNNRFSVPTDNNDELKFGNVIVDLELLSKMIKQFVRCSNCDSENCIELFENCKKRRGLATSIGARCVECQSSSSTMTSKVTRDKLYELNVRYVYGLRSIGKGNAAGKTLSAVMNLPQPPTRFGTYTKTIGRNIEQVCESSMRHAVQGAIEENVNIDKKDLSVALDGTWQKRGHTSLNGVVTATSVDTGKVIDIECLSKYCHGCTKGVGLGQNHTCSKNFEGTSGGMECKGAVAIFQRSVATRGVRYVNYLGDGDSKSFNQVSKDEPYGSDVQIKKLECVGHVQKRMGSRLLRLTKEKRGQRLSDGKLLGGKGRLTKAEIDNLQNYYGAAIRRNSNNLEGMKKDVWAIYFHKLSTNEKPQHGLCPKGEDSWCKYNRSLVTGETYDHKHSLPPAVMEGIKGVFKDLADENLLKKCLHGRTQNCNESVNSVIWTRLPKTVHVGYEVLKMGTQDAVMCFNDGNIAKAHVLDLMGIDPGLNTIIGLKNIDAARVRKAELAAEAVQKRARMSKRNMKRKREDADDEAEPEYGAGMF
jgi:hypothetical protein